MSPNLLGMNSGLGLIISARHRGNPKGGNDRHQTMKLRIANNG